MKRILDIVTSPISIGVVMFVGMVMGLVTLDVKSNELRRVNCSCIGVLLSYELAQEIGSYNKVVDGELSILATVSDIIAESSYPTKVADEFIGVLDEVATLLQQVDTLTNETIQSELYDKAALICLEYATNQLGQLEEPIFVLSARGDVPNSVKNACNNSKYELLQSINNLNEYLDRWEKNNSVVGVVEMVLECCLDTRQTFIFYCIAKIEYRNALSNEDLNEIKMVFRDVEELFSRSIELIETSDNSDSEQEKINKYLNGVSRRTARLEYLISDDINELFVSFRAELKK